MCVVAVIGHAGTDPLAKRNRTTLRNILTQS